MKFSNMFFALICVAGLLCICPVIYGNDEVSGENTGASDSGDTVESNVKNDSYIALPTIDETGSTNRSGNEVTTDNDGTDRRGNEVDESSSYSGGNDGTNRQGNELDEGESSNEGESTSEGTGTGGGASTSEGTSTGGGTSSSGTGTSLDSIPEYENQGGFLTETQQETANVESTSNSSGSGNSRLIKNYSTSEGNSGYSQTTDEQEESSIRSLILPGDIEERAYMTLSSSFNTDDLQTVNQSESEIDNMRIKATVDTVSSGENANSEIAYNAKIALVFSVPALAGLIIGLHRKRKRA